MIISISIMIYNNKDLMITQQFSSVTQQLSNSIHHLINIINLAAKTKSTNQISKTKYKLLKNTNQMLTLKKTTTPNRILKLPLLILLTKKFKSFRMINSQRRLSQLGE